MKMKILTRALVVTVAAVVAASALVGCGSKVSAEDAKAADTTSKFKTGGEGGGPSAPPANK
jgi:hypothetical protein